MAEPAATDCARAKQLGDRRDLAAAVATALLASGALLRGLDVTGSGVTVGFLAAGAILAVTGLGLFLAKRRVERRSERNQSQADGEERAARIRAALRVPVGRMEDASASKVGVRSEAPGVLTEAGQVDELPYIPRPCDRALQQKLNAAHRGDGSRLVCVVGPSRSGKSRTLLQALKGVNSPWRSALLVAPRERHDVQTLIEEGVLIRDDDAPVVLWLDDIERYARIGDFGVDVRLLEDLAAKSKWLVVAATRGGAGLDLEQRRRGELSPALDELIESEQSVPLAPELTSSAEKAALSELPTGLARRLQAGGIPVIVAGKEMVEALQTRRHPRHPEVEGHAGFGVMAAAIDTARGGLFDAIPEELLRDLFTFYSPACPEDFSEGLRWARNAIYPGVAMLEDTNDGLRPDPYLVQNAEIGASRYAEEAIWGELLDKLPASGVFQLGLRAYEEADRDRAIGAFRQAATGGIAEASFNLGTLLTGREGCEQEAEEAYHAATSAGYTRAWNNLGALLAGQEGREQEAEDAYSRGAVSGDASAWFNLGILLGAQEGRGRAAEYAFREAITAGVAAAWLYLGEVLEGQGGREREAEAAYRQGAAAGQTRAWTNLVFLLEEQGRVREAEDAFREAAAGDIRVSNTFGAWLAGQGGRDRDAEDAFRKAANGGLTAAQHNLGVLLARQEGREKEAEAAYLEAAAAGDAGDWLSLAFFLHSQGRKREAHEAAERSKATDGLGASFNLGFVLEPPDGDG